MTDPLKLYLADDDHDDCLLFEEALTELDLPVQLKVFSTGESLLDALLPGNGPAAPDLVFLDINMPGKNGLQCLEILKANKSVSQIPVVIFSTTVEETITRSAIQLGAARCIKKPSSYSELKQTLRSTLAGFS